MNAAHAIQEGPAALPAPLTMSAGDLLDHAVALGYRPFITAGGVFLVDSPDGVATPLTDLMYRRADELRDEMARRAMRDRQAR